MNNTSGVYKLKCKTSNYSYIGQTGTFPIVRCQEQETYITTNNPNFAYALRKGKAIPLQAWTGPKVSRRLRLPDFKTIGT